jgi:hypothetical protein
LLKRHNVDITDTHIGEYDLQSYLEEAPTSWEQVRTGRVHTNAVADVHPCIGLQAPQV